MTIPDPVTNTSSFALALSRSRIIPAFAAVFATARRSYVVLVLSLAGIVTVLTFTAVT